MYDLLRTRLVVSALAPLVALALSAAPLARAAAPSRPGVDYRLYVLGRLASASGFTEDVRIGRAPVAFAQAIVIDDYNAILYNPRSLDALERGTGNPWSTVSVIAHELGHHFYGHAENGIRGVAAEAIPRCELEADYFSGYALARLGASLDDAQAAQRWLSRDETPLHPASALRLDAVKAGWEFGRAGRALATASGGADLVATAASPLAEAEPLVVETGRW